MITGIDISPAFDFIKITNLIGILELFLQEDEPLITILLYNTTLVIKSSSNISNLFHASISSPLGDDVNGSLIIIYLEKALRTLYVAHRQPPCTGEHSYVVSPKSTQSDECIHC